MKLILRDPGVGYLDTLLWVPKKHVNVQGTKNALTFTFQDEHSVRVLSLYQETEHHLLVPREFWDTNGFNFRVVDCRPSTYPHVKIDSRIKLDHVKSPNGIVPTGRTVQQDALHMLLQARGGILQLACGLGKSVVALALAAEMQVPTLIVVDTTNLLNQWAAEVALHLDVGSVGLIQGDVFDWKHPIVLTTYQTLANRAADMPEEVRRWFGLVIWDEAHHVGAPVFSRSADLFYGYRLGLTATPTRADGMHVVHNYSLGKILYKDLIQELRPEINFLWTGVGVDPSDPKLAPLVADKNGELHLSKLAGYFGQLDSRLDFILDRVRKWVSEGRKIFVLSNSEDECVNLLAKWNGLSTKYSDIPFPEGDAQQLSKANIVKLTKALHATKTQLRDKTLNPVKRDNLLARKAVIEQKLTAHDTWTKLAAEHRKQRKEYLASLLSLPSTAGLMIYKVSVEERMKMLKAKQVIFGTSKYGREGLDSPELDTIIAAEPMSNRGAVQQFMGRVLRRRDGKKSPIVEILEDNIGPLIAQCKKVRHHLMAWPADEGGPYEFNLVGHPNRRGKAWSQIRVPGQ